LSTLCTSYIGYTLLCLWRIAYSSTGSLLRIVS
jgi:hypothetical protein